MAQSGGVSKIDSSTFCFVVSPVKHSGTYESFCPAYVCLSVLQCVCLSGSHTFLVVTHRYVLQVTHAFLVIFG